MFAEIVIPDGVMELIEPQAQRIMAAYPKRLTMMKLSE